MNPQQVAEAESALQKKPEGSSRKLLWLIIGVSVGVVILVISILWYLKTTSSGGGGGGGGGGSSPDSYPYVFRPRHTITSTSLRELIFNIFMDGGEDGIDYSVISRQEILKRQGGI